MRGAPRGGGVTHLLPRAPVLTPKRQPAEETMTNACVAVEEMCVGVRMKYAGELRVWRRENDIKSSTIDQTT